VVAVGVERDSGLERDELVLVLFFGFPFFPRPKGESGAKRACLQLQL
jgi:hypothetical protein